MAHQKQREILSFFILVPKMIPRQQGIADRLLRGYHWREAPTLFLPIILWKPHENEENLGCWGGHVPAAPPLGFASAHTVLQLLPGLTLGVWLRDQFLVALRRDLTLMMLQPLLAPVGNLDFILSLILVTLLLKGIMEVLRRDLTLVTLLLSLILGALLSLIPEMLLLRLIPEILLLFLIPVALPILVALQPRILLIPHENEENLGRWRGRVPAAAPLGFANVRTVLQLLPGLILGVWLRGQSMVALKPGLTLMMLQPPLTPGGCLGLVLSPILVSLLLQGIMEVLRRDLTLVTLLLSLILGALLSHIPEMLLLSLIPGMLLLFFILVPILVALQLSLTLVTLLLSLILVALLLCPTKVALLLRFTLMELLENSILLQDDENELQNDDIRNTDVPMLVSFLREQQSVQQIVLTDALIRMMVQLHYEHTIQETLTLQVNMDNKLPRGAQGKISPAKKLRVHKSVQGEGVEVIEILTETDDDSAQKTIPLILPPLIMCSAPRMIKASWREALVVCLPGNQTTGNENQNNELQAQVSDLEVDTSDPEIQTSDLEVPANEHKHLNSELEVMSSESEGQIVLDPAEPFVGLNHSKVPMCETSVFLGGQREPLVLLKKLRIHWVGPKIFTRNPERFSCPTINSIPGPYRSIEEHCTATNLSSVQRRYVGLWRPNERCL